KDTTVDCGSNRGLDSDPQAGRVLDPSFAEWRRHAIVDGVADVDFIAKNIVDHPACPRSSKVIGDAFTIEPTHDFFLRLFFLDVLPIYSLDHLDLVVGTET